MIIILIIIITISLLIFIPRVTGSVRARPRLRMRPRLRLGLSRAFVFHSARFPFSIVLVFHSARFPLSVVLVFHNARFAFWIVLVFYREQPFGPILRFFFCERHTCYFCAGPTFVTHLAIPLPRGSNLQDQSCDSAFVREQPSRPILRFIAGRNQPSLDLPWEGATFGANLAIPRLRRNTLLDQSCDPAFARGQPA